MEISKNVYQNIFIFSGVESREYEKILSLHPPSVKEFRKGEVILSEEKNKHTVGFVLSGECEVRRTRQDGSTVLLNTLLPFDSFGILSVFSSDESYPTEIFARKSSAVMFFTKDDVYSMINFSPQISINIINFLSERIAFLNKKIAAFSGGTVEQKLSSYLYAEYQSCGESFALNCKRCSDVLGVGRASVYRALNSLTEEGFISFDNKTIKIICPEGLERNTK